MVGIAQDWQNCAALKPSVQRLRAGAMDAPGLRKCFFCRQCIRHAGKVHSIGWMQASLPYRIGKIKKQCLDRELIVVTYKNIVIFLGGLDWTQSRNYAGGGDAVDKRKWSGNLENLSDWGSLEEGWVSHVYWWPATPANFYGLSESKKNRILETALEVAR